MDSLNLTTVQLGTCAVLFTGTSMFYGAPVPNYLAQLDAGQILLFGYLVLVCTVFAFFIQTWAVRRTSPSRVSLLLGTEPVWAVVVGITIAHDTFGVIGYLGIALILAGTAVGRSIEQRSRVPSSAVQPAQSSPVALVPMVGGRRRLRCRPGPQWSPDGRND